MKRWWYRPEELCTRSWLAYSRQNDVRFQPLQPLIHPNHAWETTRFGARGHDSVVDTTRSRVLFGEIGCWIGRNLLPSICLPICPCLGMIQPGPLACMTADRALASSIHFFYICLWEMSSIMPWRVDWSLGGIVRVSFVCCSYYSFRYWLSIKRAL